MVKDKGEEFSILALTSEPEKLYNRDRMNQIITRLEERFPRIPHNWTNDAFPLLIATILSQNTSENNSTRAFRLLQSRFKVEPQVLAQLDPGELKPLIKCAGMHDVRSRRIVEVSQKVLERFNGDLDAVLRLPLRKARSKLMDLEGVGPKTADILLNFLGGRPVMPIDTNIFRVVNRIGFVNGRNYERTRSVLEALIPPKRLHDMHLLLIRLGREICGPRIPRCSICPITDFCDYPVLDRKKSTDV